MICDKDILATSDDSFPKCEECEGVSKLINILDDVQAGKLVLPLDMIAEGDEDDQEDEEE